MNSRRGALPLLLGALVSIGPQVVQGQQPQQTPQIRLDSIIVEGNEVLPDSIIAAQAGLSRGATVTARDIQGALKRLMATGRYRGVDALTRGLAATATLVLRVEEEDIVQLVIVQGLETIDPDEVRDSLGMETGAPYSPQSVADAIQFIRAKLLDEGIPFATIDVERVPVPDSEGSIDVVLRVAEGDRVTVAEFEVTGNEAFTDEEITDALQTQPEGFLWRNSGSLDPELYRSDIFERLPQFYSSRGHLDLRVLRDTTILDPQTGKARIELEVDEGPLYRVGDFEVEIVNPGTSPFSEEVLATYYEPARRGIFGQVGILSGRDEEDKLPVFDLGEFNVAQADIRNLYWSEGYLDAQVIPTIVPTPAADEGEDPTVDLKWTVQPGAPAYVRTIQIIGNEHTYDRVVRDAIFLVPGAVYRQDLLIQSYQSLSGLGFFETPLPPPDVQRDPETGDVDLVFEVTERHTGQLSFGTTVGGGAGIAGFIGYDEPNLFGQGSWGTCGGISASTRTTSPSDSPTRASSRRG